MSIPVTLLLKVLVRCGPYKLARILDHCLNRYDSPMENSPAVINPETTPISSRGTFDRSKYEWSDSAEIKDLPIRTRNSNEAPGPSALDVGSSAAVKRSLNVLIVDDNAINRRYERQPSITMDQ